MLNRKKTWLLTNLAAAKEDVKDGKGVELQNKKWAELSITGDPKTKTITVSVGLDLSLFDAVKTWAERNCKDVFDVLGVLHITI